MIAPMIERFTALLQETLERSGKFHKKHSAVQELNPLFWLR